MIDHYDWPGGREAMLRFGPADGPVVVAALPLFEEKNRTRTFVVTILRELAARGVASALPDLPGTGESLVPTEAATLMQMRDAYEAATHRFPGGVYGFGIRSGALLDSLALLDGRYYLAPQDGSDLLRELARIRQEPSPDSWWAAEEVFEIGGNRISSDLLSELTALTPFFAGTIRTARLESDAKSADAKVPGAPLWRRAEPDNDPALAALLADDIAAWVRQCEG